MENLITIDSNRHILVDASVLVAAFNKSDSNHNKALFFLKNIDSKKRVILPAHTLFEMMAAINRRRNSQSYLGFEKGELELPFDTIHITQQVADRCRDAELFELFRTLRGGDLIYACIAKLYSLTLVTLDNKDFAPYQNELKLILL